MAILNVLSTKKLPPSLINEAKQNNIVIAEIEFISIHLYSPEMIHRQLAGISGDDKKHIVFTSANAVAAVDAFAKMYDDAGLIKAEVFCISGKTREAILGAKNISRNIVGLASYGKDLAQVIIEEKPVSVTFFCGNKRREELPLALKTAGIAVNEIVAYETEARPQQIEKKFDAVLFFSPSGVESFFSANQISGDAVCFAVGHTTAAAIAAFTNNKVITSNTPDPYAIIEEVKKYYKSTVG